MHVRRLRNLLTLLSSLFLPLSLHPITRPALSRFTALWKHGDHEPRDRHTAHTWTVRSASLTSQYTAKGEAITIRVFPPRDSPTSNGLSRRAESIVSAASVTACRSLAVFQRWASAASAVGRQMSVYLIWLGSYREYRQATGRRPPFASEPTPRASTDTDRNRAAGMPRPQRAGNDRGFDQTDHTIRSA